MPIGKEYTPFGRYVLIERLAVGGMAEVFLARERGDSQRTVVVKRMHAVTSSNEDARARFLDESRLATLFTHPNIVRVHDVGIHEGAYYMALEWLLGWELREIVDRARTRGMPLPVPVALKLARDAARGLAAAHGFRDADGKPLDLVHRDVNPRNLFVTADGVLKILDFGVAKSNLRSRRTQARMVVGTYGYMAPEQLEGQQVDQRTDVFSLGVVVHELLTGDKLFDRPTLDAMVQAMLQAPIAPPVRDAEALDSDVVAVVMRALQRDVSARYPSAGAFEEALQQTLDRLGEPSDQQVADTMTHLFSGSEPRSAGTQEARTEAHIAVSHWADELEPTRGEVLIDEPLRRTVDIETPEALIPNRGPQRRLGVAAVVLTFVVAGLGIALVRRQGQTERGAVASTSAGLRGPALEAAPTPSATGPTRPKPAGGEAVPPEPAVPVPQIAPERQAAPEPRPAGTPRPPTGPRDRRSGRQSRLAAAPDEPTPTGRLTLDSRPWSNVYLGTTFLGATPLVERVLPAGRVYLRLVDPVTGREQQVSVEVPAGGEVRRLIKREQ